MSLDKIFSVVESPIAIEKRRIFIIWACILASVVFSIIAIFQFQTNFENDAIVNIGFAASSLLILFYQIKHSKTKVTENLFLYFLLGVMIITILSFKILEAEVVWFIVFPVASFMLKESHKGLIISLIYSSVLLGLIKLFYPTDYNLMFYVNLSLMIVSLSIISFKYELGKEHLYKELDKKVNELKERQTHDTLTGVYSRNFFNQIFPKEIKRVEDKKLKMGFILFNIDSFKHYNDTYGHVKGDETLLEIAKILEPNFSGHHEYLFRLGGEEFSGIIYGESEDDVKKRVSNILDLFKNKAIPHKDSEHSIVTVSIGLTFVQSKGDLENEIYKRADYAISKAKNEGKDKLVIV